MDAPLLAAKFYMRTLLLWLALILVMPLSTISRFSILTSLVSPLDLSNPSCKTWMSYNFNTVPFTVLILMSIMLANSSQECYLRSALVSFGIFRALEPWYLYSELTTCIRFSLASQVVLAAFLEPRRKPSRKVPLQREGDFNTIIKSLMGRLQSW